jgi:hypothetical protein
MVEKGHTTVWPGIVALAIATGYLIALLGAEKQSLIIMLLAAGIAAVLAAAWLPRARWERFFTITTLCFC